MRRRTRFPCKTLQWNVPISERSFHQDLCEIMPLSKELPELAKGSENLALPMMPEPVMDLLSSTAPFPFVSPGSLPDVGLRALDAQFTVEL
jgi:hypothetical protein